MILCGEQEGPPSTVAEQEGQVRKGSIAGKVDPASLVKMNRDADPGVNREPFRKSAGVCVCVCE